LEGRKVVEREEWTLGQFSPDRIAERRLAAGVFVTSSGFSVQVSGRDSGVCIGLNALHAETMQPLEIGNSMSETLKPEQQFPANKKVA